MMGTVYKGVFGELPQNQGINNSGGMDPIPDSKRKGVSDRVKDSHLMTP
jgi:hypothetical protein